MNFYKRYMGDIQRDTGHLSLAEFGAYDRLLDHYYSTESALPSEIDACCRIARAMEKDEKKAVISILKQFFILTEKGYEQNRANKEIAEAQPAMVSARINGSKGGRPKNKQPETPENDVKNKPSGLSDNNPNETQPETSPEPEPYNISNRECKSNTVPNEELAKTHTQNQIGLIAKGLTEIGMMPFNPQLPKFTLLVEAGATVDEFVATALERKGTDKFNFNYLITTMTNRRLESLNAKELPKGALPSSQNYSDSITSAASAIFKDKYIAEQTKKPMEVAYEQIR